MQQFYTFRASLSLHFLTSLQVHSEPEKFIAGGRCCSWGLVSSNSQLHLNHIESYQIPQTRNEVLRLSFCGPVPHHGMYRMEIGKFNQ